MRLSEWPITGYAMQGKSALWNFLALPMPKQILFLD
jgi:hypothetical protein